MKNLDSGMLPEQMGVLARWEPEEGSEPSEEGSRASTSFVEVYSLLRSPSAPGTAHICHPLAHMYVHDAVRA